MANAHVQPGHTVVATQIDRSTHSVRTITPVSRINEDSFETGCKVVFDKEECRVYYKDELVLSRGRAKKTKMVQLPINPVSKNNVLEGLDLPITAP